MLINQVRQRGVTIIEMMIAISIISILMLLALPSMSTWLNNAQIRTAGETLLDGITAGKVGGPPPQPNCAVPAYDLSGQQLRPVRDRNQLGCEPG